MIFAIGRIERALSRIEQNAFEAPHRTPEGIEDQLETLSRRHEALRARTREVIERLDRLIAVREVPDEPAERVRDDL